MKTFKDWRAEKSERREMCADMSSHERYYWIQQYRDEKQKIAKLSFSNDTTMRDSYMAIMAKANIHLTIARRKPELAIEFKDRARRGLSYARDIRLNNGLPKMFYYGNPYFVGPGGLIPPYNFEDIKNHSLMPFAMMMRGAQGRKVAASETKLRHKGAWSYVEELPYNNSGEEKPNKWTFWFGDFADLMAFKLRYGGVYVEV